jgi:hypothetical protein
MQKQGAQAQVEGRTSNAQDLEVDTGSEGNSPRKLPSVPAEAPKPLPGSVPASAENKPPLAKNTPAGKGTEDDEEDLAPVKSSEVTD